MPLCWYTGSMNEFSNHSDANRSSEERHATLYQSYGRFVRDAATAGLDVGPIASTQREFNFRISHLEDWEIGKLESVLEAGFQDGIPASSEADVAVIMAIREGDPPPDVKARVANYYQRRSADDTDPAT